MNFFEWIIQDDVLDYIEEHHVEIQADMDTRIHEIKDVGIAKKRHELSASATKSIKCHNIAVTVKFD